MIGDIDYNTPRQVHIMQASLYRNFQEMKASPARQKTRDCKDPNQGAGGGPFAHFALTQHSIIVVRPSLNWDILGSWP